MGDNKPKKQPKYRIFELDFVRGWLIIGMIIIHLYNYWDFLSFLPVIYFSAIKDGGVAFFVFLSGITTALSKHHAKRFMYGVLIIAMLNFLTFLLDKWTEIDYGYTRHYGLLLILSFFAFCYWLLNKLPPKIYLFFCGIVFIIQCVMFDGWFNDIDIQTKVPLLQTFIDLVTRLWKPIFISLFLIGTLIGKAYYRNKHSPLLLGHLNDNKFCKPILWIGRNSLYIFVIQIFAIPLIYLFIQLFV